MIRNYLFSALFLLFSHLIGFSQSPSEVGRWSDPIGFGIVPVAVANLPDGKLITWSSQYKLTFQVEGDGLTWTELFDPFQGTDGLALGEFQSNTSHDMFCPGINNLPDGRILSAGGTSSQRTSIYDPNTGLWSVEAEMNIPRGYQGNVTLSDGSVFTLGGSWGGRNIPSTNGGKDAELWTPELGWTLLPGISGDDTYTANDLTTEARGVYRSDNHLWLWPASNGKIFHAGPSEMMHWISVENGGSMEQVGLRGNDGYSMKGTTVMFDTDKVLKVGGSLSYDSGHPAKDNSYVIDFSNENNVTVTPTANRLTYSRTMHNSTVLPNGEVLVTGGLDRAEVFSDIGARLTAEIYSPQTNSWRTVAGMQVPRTYHSVAILMVDGRVFVGGGGLCDGTNPDECENHTDAEIYSPSYLFNNDGSLATRPTISAPETADYLTSMPVTGSSGITEFNLIRFSSATHSTNNEQRRIPVSFTGNGSYTVNIPDRNLLPPGYYMLFGLDANGVPSVAETIQIGNSIPLSSDPSLVLDLKFDDGAGSVVVDDSQYGNDATIYDVDNTASTKTLSTGKWGTGLFGSALETDGVEFQSNTIVDVPYSTSMGGVSNSMTVMAWVNRDDIVYNASVFTHDYPRTFFFGFHNSLYKWEITTSDGSGSCLAGWTPTSAWVHIAATYDGQMIRLYANGQEICSKPVTGNFDLNTTEANFSTFTTSGFYERRSNPSPDYNDSGVTDELDGRIDELKVFNRALTGNQIQTYYDQGVGLPGVLDCPPGTITLEYRVNDGAWTAGNTLTADEGDQVYVRAVDYTGLYYVTTPYAYGPTLRSDTDFSTEFNAYQLDTNISSGIGVISRNDDGLIDPNSSGQYVFTMPQGCFEVFTLNVNEAPVDCTVAGSIIPEYRLDGVWQSGENELTVTEGTEVIFSMLPNGVGVAITLPNGTVVGDDYNLGNVTVADSGLYTIVSEQGCETIVELTVVPECAGTGIQAEYQLDTDAPVVGGSVTVTEGATLALGIQVDGLAFSISGPNGNTKVMDTSDLVLENLTVADSGTYTISSEEGCEAIFELTVTEPVAGCDPLPVPWVNSDVGAVAATGSVCYSNGTFEVDASGADIWNAVDEFHYVYQPLAGDGEIIARVVSLDNTHPWAKAGVMMRNTLDANSAMAFMSVSPDPNFGGPGYTYQHRNSAGEWMSDRNNIGPVSANIPHYVRIVRQGNTFTGYASSTNGDWSLVGTRTIEMNSTIYVGLSTTSHSDGVLTTAAYDNVQVIPSCVGTWIQAEYQVDGGSAVIGNAVSIDQGGSLSLGIQVDGLAFSISGPNGNIKALDTSDLVLDNLTLADSGIYTITSEEGCEATFELIVVETCVSGIIPEYRLDGIWQSGENYLTVPEGTEVMFSMLPNNIGVTIILPDGTVVGDDYNLGNVTPSNNGRYTLISNEGCESFIELTVTPYCDSIELQTEYQINAENPIFGASTVSVTEGKNLRLSIFPNDLAFSIDGPNGNSKDLNISDLVLEGVTLSDSGIYIFVTQDGCEVHLTVNVEAFDCVTLGLQTEYQINMENPVFDSSIVTVQEGENLRLSIFPDDLAFSINGPNGNSKDLNFSDLLLENLTPADSGNYIFTTEEGCEVLLTVSVETFDCSSLELQTEYRLGGANPVMGAVSLTATEGQSLVLGIKPDGIGFSVSGPNGNNKDLNLGDLLMENLTLADSGTYFLRIAEGCEIQFSLIVQEEINLNEPGDIDSILIYPNPITHGELTLYLKEFMDFELNTVIYDIKGRAIYQKIIPADHGEEEVLQLSQLSTGVYMLNIQVWRTGQYTIKKVVKIR